MRQTVNGSQIAVAVLAFAAAACSSTVVDQPASRVGADEGSAGDPHGDGVGDLGTDDHGDVLPCVTPAVIIGVRASASENADHLPEKTLDGIIAPTSYWAAEGDGQWIQFDLDRVATIDSIAIAFHRGDERQAFFDVELSVDGTVWGAALTNAASAGNSLGLHELTFACTAVRYVRIVGHGNSLVGNDWNSYTEVTIEDFPVDLEITPVPFCGDDNCDGDEACYDCSADCGACPGGTEIFANDFEDNTLGPYATVDAFHDDWDSTSAVTQLSRMETVTGIPGNPTRVFLLHYPFYDSGDFRYICWSDDRCGSSTGEREIFISPPGFGNVVFLNGVGPASGGVQFKTDFAPRNEAYLSYKIMFGDEFYPVDGGKLPGLCGGICQGGGAVADPDGNGTSDGFSARLMFEKESNGYPISLRFYVYHMDQIGTYGDSVLFSRGVSPGEWHTITQHVIMNDLNVGNGITEAWLDGELVASRTDFAFRQGATAAFSIDAILFSTFFGGSGETVCSDNQVATSAYGCSTYENGDNYYFYAPRKDEQVYFDDLVVYY